MHIEIAQAVEFLGRLLQNKLDQDSISRFKEKLTELLKLKFADHWDVQQPYKGNGFRALSNFNGQLDSVLVKAANNASISSATIFTHLPRDFVLWIDPFNVSYRMGDHGNIMTLFEDRSRGRITFKLDPNNNNNNNGNNTTTTTTLQHNSSTTITSNGMTSPSNSPLLQYLQPRTSTPIRISPPNSPEAQKIKNHINQSSPLSNQVTQTPPDNEEEEGRHLVMAN
ncbi:uncharacterized protein BX664DRAFT_338773 [Halteromyces radiatus]|uniref:uncharacterized protein n=1 Tax=Halteromyces radiatus TaxID=101107 RepID=UPI00221F5FF1|nr:uncharacterized protein BX664DRAFT_338773 [Halteromyces radiatus]KAI8085192.1 hypothetical protein BX664DRAFT_338773 [Halteromyces radiatus]